MNKRLKYFLWGFVLVALIYIAIEFIVFMSGTIFRSDIEQYCIESTAVNATAFTRKEYNEIDYTFWVSEDGSSDLQELFIFKNAQWGFIKGTRNWDRYSFIYHASSGIEEIVSDVMFTPRDRNNKKRSTNILVFYSSNKHNIANYIFTIEENDRIITETGIIVPKKAFVVVLPDLGTKDGITRKFIKVEFFDDEGNLVEIIKNR